MAKQKPQNTETAIVKSSGPSPAMLALFKKPSGTDTILASLKSKLERRNMPTLYKPEDCPVGGMVVGEIVKFVPSPVSTIKGKLIWLKNKEGMEFTFPLTGTIRQALFSGLEGKELDAACDKEIGKWLVAVRESDKQSAKYKKNMYCFAVFTAKEYPKELDAISAGS